MTAEHDLVVRGGTVIDGTGAPRRTADVAVSAGIVTTVGEVDGRGRQEVDADGALVLPGFVDIHSHYDGQAVWDANPDLYWRLGDTTGTAKDSGPNESNGTYEGGYAQGQVGAFDGATNKAVAFDGNNGTVLTVDVQL